ncbi:protein of unknown function [Shewanella benthica]|uniref:Uncharacterized protein n=1 Tax=Shewanella benthica TaxID=43661 RepID=A0A330M8B1_9GAMM|nr:protein of unknown function [Shewanella benthica]
MIKPKPMKEELALTTASKFTDVKIPTGTNNKAPLTIANQSIELKISCLGIDGLNICVFIFCMRIPSVKKLYLSKLKQN